MTTEHVLIIDDSIAIASLLANEILPLGGYKATAALSGEEGLEIARKIKPDLFLCDLEMPGINGLDVLRQLKVEGFKTPVIMMTAFGSEAIAAQALRMGVKDYIIKPFTTEEILAAVERALVESRLKLKLDQMDDMLEEYRQMLVVIQAVSQTIKADLDPEAVLSRIILAAVHGSGAKAGYIGSIDAVNGELTILESVNLPGWKGREFAAQDGTALAVALCKETAQEAVEDGHYWVYIPLACRSKLLGVMGITHYRESPPTYVHQLYSVLAGYASNVLDNKTLRTDLSSTVLETGESGQ